MHILPKDAAIPLVGQPCHLKGAVLTTVLQCNCEGQVILVAVGTSVVQCGICRRRCQVRAFSQDAQGQVAVNIGLVVDGPSVN